MSHPVNFSREDIVRLCKLARLHIDDSKLSSTAQSLSDIFAMIDRMQKVDTTEVRPMQNWFADHPEKWLPWRDDVAETIDQKGSVALVNANAPQMNHDAYQVPVVVE